MALFGKLRDSKVEDAQGSDSEVLQAWAAFAEMSVPRGRVDQVSFARYFHRRDRLQVVETAKRMLFKHQHSTMGFNEFIKLLWPTARDENLREMRLRVESAEVLRLMRAETPPLLPFDQVQEINSVFSSLDARSVGKVPLECLVEVGLMLATTADELMVQEDKDSMSRADFQHWMCPHGYRAGTESQEATAPDGSRLFRKTLEDCAEPVPTPLRGQSKRSQWFAELRPEQLDHLCKAMRTESPKKRHTHSEPTQPLPTH